MAATLSDVIKRCEDLSKSTPRENVYNIYQKDEPVKIERWELIGIPRAYRNSTFDTFKGNDILVRAVKDCKDSMVLFGKTGCGKTHLACAYLQKNSGRFANAPELLLKIRDTFRDGSKLSEAQLIDQYSSVSLLILDDLGSEKSSEYSITTLYLIIDRRIRDEKQTIITTNLSLSEVEKHLSSRISSRMAGMQNFTINMPDYRKKR